MFSIYTTHTIDYCVKFVLDTCGDDKLEVETSKLEVETSNVTATVAVCGIIQLFM